MLSQLAAETEDTPTTRSRPSAFLLARRQDRPRRASLQTLALGTTLLLGPALTGLSQTANQAPPRPNIVFIFSDDHAYQAISAYGDPRQADRDAPHRPPGQRGDALRPLPRAQLDLRAQPRHGPDRQVHHINGFYNNTNSRFDGSQTTFPKLLRQAGYQTAIIGKWHLVTDPTGFDDWHILPGQGVYYNPPMIHNGQRDQAPGLHDRHHHRPAPRLAQESRQVASRSC